MTNVAARRAKSVAVPRFPSFLMSFARSDALFPSGDLLAVIRQDYEQQCKVLRFEESPSWDEVQARFAELQPLL